MKSKLTMMVAMAVTCVAVQLTAMPTEKETKQAEPIVRRLLASEREALESGKKTRSEVADKAVELAGEADSDAAKLLLMKGAFVLYVQDGNLEKAVETMKALEAAIADMPPQSVTNMIELALLGVSKTGEGARLYKILDEKRGADRPNVKYKFSYKLEGGNAIITSIDPKPAGTVVIPDKIDGHKVTGMEGYNDESPFWGCDQLTRVVLPSGLEEGPAGALMSCKSLSSIEISSSNKKFASLDGALYSKDFSTLIVYPKTRESIKLSPKTRKIGGCAFRGCAWHTAKIPEGIVEVGHWNLCGCPDLEWVEFPKSLKFLGHCAAHGNDKLKKIVFNGDAPKVGLAQFTWGKQYVFTGAPENLVVEVRKGTKGWKSPDSTELPARWPTNQKYSRPIRYIGAVKANNNGSARINDGKANATSPTPSANGLWTVAQYNGSSSISSLAGAQELVEQTPKVAEKTYQTLSLGNNDSGLGDFPHVDFPGTSGSANMNYFVITAKGSIYVPYAGDWTFACRSDDGFRFIISGNGLSDTFEHGLIRGLWQGTLLHTVHFPCAGIYSVTCLFFENFGNAGLEYSVAHGSHSRFDSSKFKLVGAPESGIVMVGDVKDAGRQVQAERGDAPGGALARLRERRMRLMRETRAENAAAQQQQATVDGYTWSYRVKNGEATIVAEKNGKHSCAVSPTPTGEFSIPATLGGVKVTHIGWEAFRYCKELTSVTIPEGVTHIDGHTFDQCYGLKSVTLPSSLKGIGWAAFGGCAELKSIVIPEGVTSIRADTFNGCLSLKNVVIPNSMTHIGERAFLGCHELTSVTIPEKVAAIGEGAFGCGSKLKQIDLAAGNQSFALVDGVLYKKDLSVLLACPGAKTSVTIPEGVTKIGAFAFRNCSGLKSVTIPEGVTKIEWVAFVYCKGLTSVTIPKSVKAFGPEAFKECVELASVTMLGECPKAQNDIFRKCGKLKAIHVPANAKSWAGMKEWQGIPLVFDNGNAVGKRKTVTADKETVDGIEWTYNIIGGQAQVDYASSSNVTGAISIPSTLGGCPVTSIGRNEFRSGFGWRVFEKCGNNLTSVAIPSGVVNIGDSAFYGCSNLVSVTIPASVTNIARCAFSRCASLTSFAVDAENTKYSSRNGLLCSKDGSALIAGVNGDVTIPPSVKHIVDYAFQGRIGLKSVMIPSGVTSVGLFAFEDCGGLKSVAIPASMKKIGWYAFSGCSGLMSFSVDPDNPSFSSRDGMLCSKNGSTLVAGVNGDVTIPPCVKEIGSHAFLDHSGLKSVRIPESVTSIAAGAFRGCDSLPSVTIPSRVTSIGPQAFYWCKKLASVTIPASVTKIERSAFSGCSELTSFSVDPGNPSYSSRNGLLCSKDGSKLVMGVNGDVTIPPGVKDIGDHAFQGCVGLTSVAIPSSVTNIGREAFDQCKGLASVAIPSSVKSIGSRAFTMCFQLKSVTIPEGVTSIGEYAFAWCHAIEAVAIPQSVTDIKGNTFAGCGGLKSVTIPNSVTSIGDYSFVGCNGLTAVTIPASVTYVGVGAFYRCDGLKTVALPSSVASIGKGAFAETPFYDGMPDGLVVLGGGVLCKYKGECPSSVTIPSNVTSIGEHAFRACSRLESLTIPSTVTNIDGRAFVECPNLRTVHVVREGKVETMSFDDFFKRWKNVVAQRLQRCDFLLNKDFKRDAKVYLCLFSASWCGPCRAEMPRIAKTYAKSLKDDPNIELILFSRDQNDEEALAWAKEHDVKFPVVKYSGGNPLNLQTSGIPHLFIVKADGALVEEGRPMKLFTDEKLRSLTTAN